MADHIHKLKRHTYKNGTKVFFCAANCNFKVETGLALGLVSICHQCNNPFIMNELTIKMAKPHCSNCGKTMVKTPDGKRKFVNKQQLNEIAADIAGSQTLSLRERLGRVVTMEKDEDI